MLVLAQEEARLLDHNYIGTEHILLGLLAERADPESKGGSEAIVRVAKADLVPIDVNLLPAYGSWRS